METAKSTGPVADLRKRVKDARVQHDTHVGLLMLKHGISKPDAIILAYLNGYEGIAAAYPTGMAPTHNQAKPEATK